MPRVPAQLFAIWFYAERGIPAESTEYRMSQEEWDSLQRSEPEVIEPFSVELPRAVPLEDTAEIYDIYGSGRENLPETAVGANKASPWGEFVASSKEFFPEGANAARDVDVPTTDPRVEESAKRRPPPWGPRPSRTRRLQISRTWFSVVSCPTTG